MQLFCYWDTNFDYSLASCIIYSPSPPRLCVYNTKIGLHFLASFLFFFGFCFYNWQCLLEPNRIGSDEMVDGRIETGLKKLKSGWVSNLISIRCCCCFCLLFSNHHHHPQQSAVSQSVIQAAAAATSQGCCIGLVAFIICIERFFFAPIVCFAIWNRNEIIWWRWALATLIESMQLVAAFELGLSGREKQLNEHICSSSSHRIGSLRPVCLSVCPSICLPFAWT